jgi:bacillolysin
LAHGYGNKQIDTWWRGGIWGHHVLRTDDISGRDVYSKKLRLYSANTNGNVTKPFGGINTNNYFDQDDVWPQSDDWITTPHWGVTKAWDYFFQNHNRKSWDNNGLRIKINADADVLAGGPNNAAFVGILRKELAFSNTNNIPFSTIDICGHEFTHGIIAFTSQLDGKNEPGALAEAFGDIFGSCVEVFAEPGKTIDWTIAEDFSNTNI